MTLISKSAGILSMGSALVDIHKTALKYSNEELARTSANIIISDSLNSQKSDTFSYKDAQRKNWISQKNFLATPKEFFGRIKGYFKGVGKIAPRYIPNFVLGVVALTTKVPFLARFSTIALGTIEACDFIANATSITQRNDQIKF